MSMSQTSCHNVVHQRERTATRNGISMCVSYNCAMLLQLFQFNAYVLNNRNITAKGHEHEVVKSQYHRFSLQS